MFSAIFLNLPKIKLISIRSWYITKLFLCYSPLRECRVRTSLATPIALWTLGNPTYGKHWINKKIPLIHGEIGKRIVCLKYTKKISKFIEIHLLRTGFYYNTILIIWCELLHNIAVSLWSKDNTQLPPIKNFLSPAKEVVSDRVTNKNFVW